jgi:hypothetical protein
MSTVIDELIVVLKLDGKAMTSQSLAATKGLKDVEEQGKKTGEGFESLAKAVGGFLALIGGTMALRSFISDQIEVNANLERMSKNLGINVSDLSAWGNAVEEVGGSAAGLQGTMAMLSRSQTELRLTGQSSLIPYFSALGVSLADAGGKARPVNDILLSLSDRFSKMDRTTAVNMGKMMGIDPDTMNLLVMGRKELELTLKRQKEHNAVTAAQAEQAVKLQRAIVDVKQTFNALGRTLLEKATPALEWLVSLMQRIGDWAQKNSEFLGDFAKVLGVVAVAVGAIALVTSPLALITAGILALAAGIALLWQDYQTWKRGGDSLIDWGKWQKEIDFAIAGIEKLKNAIKSIPRWAAESRTLTDKTAVGRSLNNASDNARDSIKGWFGVGPKGGNKGGNKSGGDTGKAVSAEELSGGDTGKAVSAEELSGGDTGKAVSAEELAAGIEKMEGAHDASHPHNRPQRNNNPGDMEYGPFAKAHGATGTDGGFAIFANYAAGHNALLALLRSKNYAGLSVAQAITKYAPPNENNTKGYIASVMRGIPGATATLAGTPMGGSGSSSHSTDASVTNHIGSIVVQTQATDAKGIASDMGRSMDYLFTSQANAGLY